MLNGGHWAYDGTFAYPFIIRNLKHSLFILADFLTSQAIPFAIDGGIALGAIKMRSVLPWESGDIDMYVYSESRENFYNILSKFASDHHFSSFNTNPVQFFPFPPNIARKVGGIATIFVHTEKVPDMFIKIKTNGRWIPYQKMVFHHLRSYYKLDYFQHKMFHSSDLLHCKIKDHNACLPDFRKLAISGGTGTFREFFRDS
jgi:phosphorylcholine metabolism protein LicD